MNCAFFETPHRNTDLAQIPMTECVFGGPNTFSDLSVTLTICYDKESKVKMAEAERAKAV